MRKTLAILMSTLLVLPGTNFAASSSGDENEVTPKGKSNKSEWSLVWSDEFNGNEIDRSKWTYDIGNWIVDGEGNGITPGWGNNEKEYYTDSKENAFIRDGNLVIKAKKEQKSDAFGTYDYTSAKLKSKGLFSKKYGRYEIKAKLPVGKGLWPAIWMLPEADKYGAWAASGEIDIVEAWGSRPHTVAGTIHYGEGWPNNKYSGKEYELPEQRGIDKWHTYVLEWEPGELRWYVDGELYQTQNNWYSKGKDTAAKYAFPAPFDQEFYLVMNLAVGGWFDGDPDETTLFPKEMSIDYVRVYDLKKRDYQEPIEPVAEPIVLPEGAKQPLEDGNLIYDNRYLENITVVDGPEIDLHPTYWNFVHLPEFGGSGALSVEPLNETNFAKTTITNPGSQLYSLQLIQNLSLGNGGKYKVSFDAKSNGSRNMMVKVGAGASRGWVKYSNEETYKLTDQIQSYEFTFDMLNETDIQSRLEFNLGGNGSNPVWIGNVRVEDITGLPEDYNASKQPLADGNHVYNGTFDQGDMSRFNYWNFEVEEATAFASVNEESRELQVAIQNGGSHPSNIKVNQKGLYLVKGNDYKATFKARATEPRTIEVDFKSEDGNTSYSSPQVIELTTNMEEKTVSFTMPKEITDPNGQIVFNLGGNDADVYLDDIVLIKTSDKPDYGNIDLFPLKNGDFEDGFTSWSQYVHYDANAAITLENGEAKAAIGSEGDETWSVILQQENMSLAKGVNYEVSFEARSTKPRDIELSIENAQYIRFLSETIALTEQNQSYQFTFKMPTDDLAALKFLMGKSSQSPVGAHDIMIDHVVVKVKDAGEPEVELSTPGIDNGTFDQGTEGWSSWWGDQWSGYAEGTISAESGELKVAIKQVGYASYSPQIFQKDLLFEKGSRYTVTFDARAEAPRKMNVNIGKELSNDPWFIPYAATQTFDLTNEMKTYSFTFDMLEESYDDGKLVFELGNIVDGNAATNVYLDNIVIQKN
ncbi:carbohydrate binding domain-containing protein [Neobacillus sp. D3-1R]|uniref:carbohydrate binding domain-containing protein n=1 Tax=Neobacillus sp. D3-1R TaxID=3445778 RepID=UPI003FA19052